jgi:Fe2+ or Zn2+ uptake regulation protein
MSIACCITKATDTHSEHVIINASPLQQQLHERASNVSETASIYLVLLTFKLRGLLSRVSLDLQDYQFEIYILQCIFYCVKNTEIKIYTFLRNGVENIKI